uniref:Nucleoporin NUP35 n=1 Tax=Macrostomum lignano TaxID=282301 RepID=A0A1I8F549_9PLAT
RDILPQGEAAFLHSISRSAVWATTGGKSRASFYKTADDRFVLKRVSSSNRFSRRDGAATIVSTFTSGPGLACPCCLAKILKGTYVLMENLLYNCRIDRVFDLKGSERESSRCLSGVPNGWCCSAALLCDTNFLRQHNIMDYSLILGLADDQVICGIVDYIRDFTIDKMVEYLWKKIQSEQLPTVINPQLYQERFLAAMGEPMLISPLQAQQQQHSLASAAGHLSPSSPPPPMAAAGYMPGYLLDEAWNSPAGAQAAGSYYSAAAVPPGSNPGQLHYYQQQQQQAHWMLSGGPGFASPMHQQQQLALSTQQQQQFFSPAASLNNPLDTSAAAGAAGANTDDGTWVTVFGFPSGSVSFVLQQLAQCGRIERHTAPAGGGANWVHVKFQNRVQARRALCRNGRVLSANCMIGVQPCQDPAAAADTSVPAAISGTPLAEQNQQHQSNLNATAANQSANCSSMRSLAVSRLGTPAASAAVAGVAAGTPSDLWQQRRQPVALTPPGISRVHKMITEIRSLLFPMNQPFSGPVAAAASTCSSYASWISRDLWQQRRQPVALTPPGISRVHKMITEIRSLLFPMNQPFSGPVAAAASTCSSYASWDITGANDITEIRSLLFPMNQPFSGPVAAAASTCSSYASWDITTISAYEASASCTSCDLANASPAEPPARAQLSSGDAQHPEKSHSAELFTLHWQAAAPPPVSSQAA